MPKYGMNMLLWTTDVTDEHGPILEMLKKQGYDGVEVPIFETEVSKYVTLANKLGSIGLECTAVGICDSYANPISHEPITRGLALRMIRQKIDCCQALGSSLFCGPLHSALGVFTGAGPTSDERKQAKEVLFFAAEHASKAGVTLALEYLNRFESYFLTCAADAAQFVAEVNHPNLRTMYDTFHANIEEKNLANAIRTISPVMAHVHISENDRSTPGEGNVDWTTTFKTLKEVKYDNWLTVEAFGLALPALAAATKIWRKMFLSEEALTMNALKFMKAQWETA